MPLYVAHMTDENVCFVLYFFVVVADAVVVVVLSSIVTLFSQSLSIHVIGAIVLSKLTFKFIE